MNGTDVCGYLFRGETFCPSCIYDLFVPFDLVSGPHRSTEEILDRAAKDMHINRYDERSLGRRPFPQALYEGDVTEGDRCFFCGTPLPRPEP